MTENNKGKEINPVWETADSQETYRLGERLGRQAKPGQIYCLDGELGVGKTVFAQGFAAGLGIAEPVCSPTFTILQQYDQGEVPFYHFDVYRIGHVEEMEEIGYEDYFYGEGLTMVEWGNYIAELLPPRHTEITVEKDLEKGFDYRKITITEVSL